VFRRARAPGLLIAAVPLETNEPLKSKSISGPDAERRLHAVVYSLDAKIRIILVIYLITANGLGSFHAAAFSTTDAANKHRKLFVFICVHLWLQTAVVFVCLRVHSRLEFGGPKAAPKDGTSLPAEVDHCLSSNFEQLRDLLIFQRQPGK